MQSIIWLGMVHGTGVHIYEGIGHTYEGMGGNGHTALIHRRVAGEESFVVGKGKEVLYLTLHIVCIGLTM